MIPSKLCICTYLNFKLWKKIDIKKNNFMVQNPLNDLEGGPFVWHPPLPPPICIPKDMQDFTTDNFFQIIIKTFIPHPPLCTTHFTKLYLEIIKLSLDTHCLHYLALFISEFQSDTIYKDSCVPVCKLEELIKQLSKNSSPDMDGVTAEHLTHCIGTDLLINCLWCFLCASSVGSFQTVFALVY